MLLIPNINNIYVFLIPILIFGTAQALNIPSLHTSLVSLAPSNQRAVFMSLNGMVIRLGQTLGPLIIGLGYSLYDLEGAYYMGAIVSLLALVVLFTMIDKNKLVSKGAK